MRRECARVQEMLVEFASGGLDASERSMIEEHCAACAACAEERAALERLLEAVRDDGYRQPSPFHWTRFEAKLRRRLESGRRRGESRTWPALIPRLAPAAVALFCFAVGLWLGLRPVTGGVEQGAPPRAVAYGPVGVPSVISPESKLLVDSGRGAHPAYAADTLRPSALAPFGDPPGMVLAASQRLAIVGSGPGQGSLGR